MLSTWKEAGRLHYTLEDRIATEAGATPFPPLHAAVKSSILVVLNLTGHQDHALLERTIRRHSQDIHGETE
jgi:hypothetical protein